MRCRAEEQTGGGERNRGRMASMYGTLGDSSAFYGNKVGEAMSHVCVASGFLDFWLSWIFFLGT
jgi:hypothetical protein